MKVLIFLILTIAINSKASDRTNLQLLSEKFPSVHAALFRNLKGQSMNQSYDFDANRSPENALKEGMGGQCNMHAQVAALALIKSGIPPQNLRIVSAINNTSLDKLCLGRKGKPASKAQDSLTGHVFLLLKSDDRWYLINTTTVPGTPPAKRFGKLGLEYISFMSPSELEAQMAQGPTALPNEVKGSLPPEIFGDMTIFSSVQPDRYPLNDFAGRRKLVASGSLSTDICRYNGSSENIKKPPKTPSAVQ